MISFGECLRHAARTPALVAEFDRLQGSHLSTLDDRTPLDAMIDDATARHRDDVLAFAAFVFHAVYLPLNPPAD